MFDVEVVYPNGETEILHNVISYSPICEGRLMRVVHRMNTATLIPTNSIIKISNRPVNTVASTYEGD